MQNINDIKNRIKSVKDTSQITKAMEMISVSKLRRASIKFDQNIRFYHRVRYVLKDILNHKGDITHPYLHKRETKRTAFVVIASNNGMAGDYNNRVLSFAYKNIIGAVGEKSVFTIGQTANEFFTKRGIIPDIEFLYCAEDPTLSDARNIAADLINLYDENQIDEINIIYTSNDSKRNFAKCERLLPLLKEDFLDLPDDTEYYSILEFEPSPKEVFDILVPQYIIGQIYSSLIQATKCEHTERIETMNHATNNASDMLKDLELEFHRVRQEQITTEIAEISSWRK